MKTELVTTLKRRATSILSELRTTHDPVLITEHGKPSAYLVDVDTFEMLQERVKVLEGIARGEKAIRSGDTLSQSKAREKMGKWLK